MDEITKTQLICVEGRDEVNFFTAIFSFLNIDNVQILDFEGKSNFRTKIKSLVLIPGFDKVVKLALIRDADNDAIDSIFASLTASLESVSLTIPESNQVFSNGNPSVGIFIMPGNSQPGALEDLCISSITADANYCCIENYFDCIDTPLTHPSKAKVLCFLSCKEPYSNSLGLGALKGHWNFSNDAFNSLTEFLANFN